ncbi:MULTISPECIES: methylamine dehydrogenase accessory protein MauD [Pseudomonas]|jgi:methylamine dehydrogenase accessory protein MauD|uniref:Methylamine utilization protein MauD n=1 Tax=Pseudomonas flexibilis TaxID=706570 RepID=A0A0B3C237_9PSED|nr:MULTISPECIES: methylamine dehydrogenase accessory protein MauD [Pseudomonas]KHO65587.1 thiol-disulfide isomerase [Pseudomonas flexibilis]MCO2926898.1 methylamine dehydrogenase accessory protein MauD [Pseudomonas aeruginosa]MEE2520586.1 methylamine dehydrogenase accessory protein MauD [Pseudomonas aeruginosa]SCX79922.1 methylamine dehydrogenase accessory protein MauD [Pseudomonas flexibilis]SOV26022.1 Methylamine utilization protein MauD [Pseudomonas aeruginosa]
MSLLIFAVCVLTVLVLALIVMVFALARQIGILFERISPVGAMVNDSGPKLGEVSPAFNLPSLTGGLVQIGAVSPKHTLIFFLSPTCPICKKLLPVLASIRQSETWLDVVLASDGEEARHRDFIARAELEQFPYVISEQLGVTYRVARLPFAVLLDGEGVVKAKGLVNTREQLESLFNAAETGYASIQDFASRTAHS